MSKNYTLRDIDEDLWRRVKSLAALKDTTIKELIISLLARAVEEHEKGKK